MNVVEPYAIMLNDETIGAFTLTEGINKLRRVEYAARVSHRSEDSATSDSWEKFIRSVVVQHGDWSVVEHEKVACEFLVDRGITHEIVRHRIGSYTQESTRFVNYMKKGGEAKFIQPNFEKCEQLDEWRYACEVAEQAYMNLLRTGVTPQIARGVLPNSLASKIIVTYNLRSWRHFFIMRTSAQAHPQMRQVCDPLLVRFKKCIPVLYEDLESGQQQSEAMKAIR